MTVQPTEPSAVASSPSSRRCAGNPRSLPPWLRGTSDLADTAGSDYVVVTAGQYDLLVELVAADRNELLEVTNRMRALDGVASTETFLYMQMVKQLYDWGIRVHEEDE